MKCRPLVNPHNGRVEMNGRGLGQEASYVCQEGHQLSFGDQIRTCTLRRGWSGLEPCCVRKCIPISQLFPVYILISNAVCTIITEVSSVVCDELRSPTTSTVVVTGLREGDQARYSCNEGLTQASGNAFRVCLPSGFWSGDELLCSMTCPPLIRPDNGTVTLSGNRPGDRALYSCNSNFVLVTGSERECQENGTWSETPSACNRKSTIRLTGAVRLYYY